MFDPAIILAQAADPMENLINSEVELQQLSQQLNDIKEEYQVVVNNLDQPSFFNFDNVYFWFVIAGLLLLVFGLGFLLAELKKPKNLIKREKKIKMIQATEPMVSQTKVTSGKSSSVLSRDSKRRVIKVAVRKVKKKQRVD